MCRNVSPLQVLNQEESGDFSSGILATFVSEWVVYFVSESWRPLQRNIQWVPNVGKNVYLLSIIDVHTRRILKDYFSFNIKQNHVIDLLSTLFDEYNYPESVVIRSDNGSQFIAKSVRKYLGLIGVQQEFTHVATPEENAHIEAYHGILKKEVFSRFDYRTFGEIQQILKRFVSFYNNERLHGLLGRITPMEKWNSDKHLIIMKKLTA